MAFSHPTPFREAACERLIAGERPNDLGEELGVSAGTLYRWKAQALITLAGSQASRAMNPTSSPELVGASRTSSRSWS